MKSKNRMKKTMSIVLMLVLIFSFFGEVMTGPESMALVKTTQLGKIGLKMAFYDFDSNAESFDEISDSKMYSDDSLCLVFKRKSGCRIPKGSYVKVFYANDYNEFREDGLTLAQAEKQGYKPVHSSNGIKKDCNQTAFYWKKPWKAGNYVILLICPVLVLSKTGTWVSGITYYTYKRKIYRYG